MQNIKTILNTHPCFSHANEFKTLCSPLEKIQINYFGYAHLNHDKKLTVMNNHPDFLAHYLQKKYYNADIHLAQLSNNNQYLIVDALELSAQSKLVNEDAKQFGVHHLFTVINHDHTGKHFYHFANESSSYAINQFYVNNLDLLKTFIQYFHSQLQASSQLALIHEMPLIIDDKQANFSVDSALLDQQTDSRKTFLKAIGANLSPQQTKCVELLIKGYAAKQIAAQLSLSQRTVENYLAHIRQQFGFKNSREIITYFLKEF